TYSAFTTLFLSMHSILYFAAHLLDVPVPGPEWLQRFYVFGAYFFFESLARLVTSMKLEEPMGSLLFYVPVELWRAIKNNFDSAYQQRQLEKMKVNRRSDELFFHARDEMKTVTSKDYDLEIISPLPKDHWNMRTGIQIDGAWYGLIDSSKIRDGEKI